MKHIYIDNDKDINQAIDALTAGNLIIYPTETSYGLGADATNPDAINKLLVYKGNRLNKAISVTVSSMDMAKQYIEFNSTATSLFNSVLPGPVTLVAKSQGQVAPKVESERHTLGIRYSSHPLVIKLTQAFGKPITATSANTSGIKQIYSFEDWRKYVPISRQSLIDLFFDAGQLQVKPPSTIIDTTLNNPEILRQGEIIFKTVPTLFTSNSPKDTMAVGRQLILNHLDLVKSKSVIFALEGDLGTGKTHFAKGVAQALNISETVTSPTYTIMREYPYQTPKIDGILYHIDTWRLFDNESLDDLNLKPKLQPGTIVVIEWQQKITDWLKQINNVAIAYIKINTLTDTKRQILVQWS